MQKTIYNISAAILVIYLLFLFIGVVGINEALVTNTELEKQFYRMSIEKLKQELDQSATTTQSVPVQQTNKQEK